jgi:hypothetical protein
VKQKIEFTTEHPDKMMVDRTNEQEYASELHPIPVMLQRGLQ